MIVFSKTGRNKIYHLHDCTYVEKAGTEKLGRLDNHAQALREGYRCCCRCDAVARRVASEEAQIRKFCAEHELICLQEPGALVINTVRSQWRLVPRDAYLQLQLYHRNWLPNKYNDSDLEDYHLQKVKSSTVIGFLEYIVNHERYRENVRNKNKKKREKEKKARERVHKIKRDTSYLNRNPKHKRRETFTAGQLYSILDHE